MQEMEELLERSVTEQALQSHALFEAEQLCELGREVITLEAEAIVALLPRIDHHFVKACHLLLQCQGRIIVTGIGKSGHIARKLAATLASTGSPAFFLHPGEAKHGDMGMITSQDVVLAVSHSGETEEIVFILPAIKRINIPLITLTGHLHSTLAKAASVNLDVSVAKEACPLGLAPTSSTTAALVMGDALAIAMLQKRGFTVEDFAIVHPGGSLGRRLLVKVDDLMHRGAAMPRVTPTTVLKKVLLEMSEKKLGMTTVMNEQDELVGVFTDGDVRRIFEKNVDIYTMPIQDQMNRSPKVISLGTLAAEALHTMQSCKITSLIVVNSLRKVEGVIHLHDILQAGIV